MAQENQQRSMFDLMRDIGGNIEKLIRSEVRLVKVEVAAAALERVPPVKTMAAGAIVLLYAGGLLLVALVMGLALVIPIWAASLSVGFVMLLIGVVMVNSGRAKLRALPKVDIHLADGKKALHG